MPPSDRCSVLGAAAILFAGFFLVPGTVRAQGITVSTAAQYSSGDYIFTEQTDVFAWSNAVSIHRGRLQVGISVPFLAQSAPWVTYTGAGPAPSGGPEHGRVGRGRRGAGHGGTSIPVPDTVSYSTSGFGDPQLRASVDLIPADPLNAMSVQGTGVLKPPLADADAGFSTGAWDAGLGLSVARTFRPWFVLVEGTYWWLGDLDELVLENGITYSVAVGRSFLSGKWGLLASVSGATTVIETVDPPVTVNGGLSFSPGNWGLNATVGAGFTEGAADWSVGLGGHVTIGD